MSNSIAMDGVAQKLGLDMFNYTEADVYNAIDALQGAVHQEHSDAANECNRAIAAENALAQIRDYLKDQSERRNHVLEVDIPCLIDSVIGVDLPAVVRFAQEPELDQLPF